MKFIYCWMFLHFQVVNIFSNFLKNQVLSEKSDFKYKLFWPFALWLHMPSLQFCQSQNSKEVEERIEVVIKIGLS